MANKNTVDSLCAACGLNPVARKGKPKNGRQYYRNLCNRCYDNPYGRYKKPHCEHCGFVAVDLCQLDVDHIDGNHRNNDPANLQTLCANCHRLKTKLAQDWLAAAHRNDSISQKIINFYK